MWRLVSALLLAAAAPQLGEGEEGAGSHSYCIVGGGPGGLQLGQFLLSAGRDYMIFERGTGPGFFFERFPIHRQLISLNKRHTGRDNPEFSEPAHPASSPSRPTDSPFPAQTCGTTGTRCSGTRPARR